MNMIKYIVLHGCLIASCVAFLGVPQLNLNCKSANGELIIYGAIKQSAVFLFIFFSVMIAQYMNVIRYVIRYVIS